jgi:hypothetical protein
MDWSSIFGRIAGSYPFTPSTIYLYHHGIGSSMVALNVFVPVAIL